VISVTIVGGPEDGAELVLDGAPHWLVCGYIDETEMTEMSEVNVTKVGMPVRLTRSGYRAYWSERT